MSGDAAGGEKKKRGEMKIIAGSVCCSPSLGLLTFHAGVLPLDFLCRKVGPCKRFSFALLRRQPLLCLLVVHVPFAP